MVDRERPEQQDQGDQDVRHQVKAGPEGAALPCLADLSLVDGERKLPVLARGQIPASQGLEHPDAGRGLLHVGGQVVLLVLDPPGEHPVSPLESQAERRDRGEHQGGEQPEHQVQPDQQRQDDREGGQIGDQEDDAEAGEPPDRREVRGPPGQQLARLPGLVETWLQPLQVRVEPVAHRLLHRGHGPGLDPAAHHVERDLGSAERDSGQADRKEQPVPCRPPDLAAAAIGPSIAALVSSGMTISVPIARSAAVSMKRSWP